MNFKTRFNAKPEKGERNTLPSLTVPDQTMSVREIYERFARGLPVSGERVPIYEGEDDYAPDPRRLDLADRQTLAEQAAEELADIKERLSKKPTPKPKKENEAAKEPANGSEGDPKDPPKSTNNP